MSIRCRNIFAGRHHCNDGSYVGGEDRRHQPNQELSTTRGLQVGFRLGESFLDKVGVTKRTSQLSFTASAKVRVAKRTCPVFAC